MKNRAMRVLVTVFLGLMVITVGMPIVSAQDNMGQGAMAGQGAIGSQGNTSEIAAKLEKMSAALQLTPAQKQQIKPILMQEAPKLKALKADTSMPPMQNAMKMRQISEDTDSKLQPILTPEQNQKWQQMRAEERQQMMQKMENR
jgi:Spy/CpxP family protein refolding chaperone